VVPISETFVRNALVGSAKWLTHRCDQRRAVSTLLGSGLGWGDFPKALQKGEKCRVAKNAHMKMPTTAIGDAASRNVSNLRRRYYASHWHKGQLRSARNCQSVMHTHNMHILCALLRRKDQRKALEVEL
jgi:hypothetical protein